MRAAGSIYPYQIVGDREALISAFGMAMKVKLVGPNRMQSIRTIASTNAGDRGQGSGLAATVSDCTSARPDWLNAVFGLHDDSSR